MFNNYRITRRFAVVMIAFWVAFMALAAVSYLGLVSARDNLKKVHEQAMIPALQLSDSMDKIVQNRLQVYVRKNERVRVTTTGAGAKSHLRTTNPPLATLP